MNVAVVSSIIAAVVALTVALLGHWQWRRQQAATAAARYRTERADALAELWSKINDHSVAARIAQLDAGRFFQSVQDLNFFLIRRAPFLTESEKDAARLYLESIYAFRVLVEKSRNRAARREMESTGRLGRVGEIAGAVESGKLVQRVEDALAGYIRGALDGTAVELDTTRLRAEFERSGLPAQLGELPNRTAD